MNDVHIVERNLAPALIMRDRHVVHILTMTIERRELFVALVVARFAVWVAYRRSLRGGVAPQARAALDSAGRVLLFAGTFLPLALMAAAAFAGAWALPIIALAGLPAAFAGAWLKLVIVTRAGFNQGFALAHVPVRGARP